MGRYSTEYTFEHLGLDPTLRDHVSMDFFNAGDMMYTNRPSLEKLSPTWPRFIATAAP